MYVTALYHFSLERHFTTICSQSASHQARKYETRLGGGLRCTNKLINVYPCCIYYAFSIISLTAYHFLCTALYNLKEYFFQIWTQGEIKNATSGYQICITP